MAQLISKAVTWLKGGRHRDTEVFDYFAVKPPSITSSEPVTHEDSSEAR